MNTEIHTTGETIQDISLPDPWEGPVIDLTEILTDGAPRALAEILGKHGLAAALTAVSYVDTEYIPAARLLACYYANRTLAIYEGVYPADKRPAQSIDAALRYARVQGDYSEISAGLKAAHEAAWDAINDSADNSAANDAAGSARWASADEDDIRACVWPAAADALNAILLSGSPASGAAAEAAARADFQAEFLRFCRLEGEYGQLSAEAKKMKDRINAYHERIAKGQKLVAPPTKVGERAYFVTYKNADYDYRDYANSIEDAKKRAEKEQSFYTGTAYIYDTDEDEVVAYREVFQTPGGWGFEKWRNPS